MPSRSNLTEPPVSGRPGDSAPSGSTPRDATPGDGTPSAERVQKYLSRAGVASRRAAEEMILAGRVSVNGAVIRELGVKVVAGTDIVRVDGRDVEQPAELWYVMLNKPAGVVTTLDDPQHRPTVARYIPAEAPRLFPVGRLDADTTGLLLLTNDGDLAHMLMHPRHHVPKVYRAEVDGVPDEADLRRLREGITLDDGRTAPAGAEILGEHRGGSVVEIVLREGKKRQVRRMLSAVRHPVRGLMRTAYGPLSLGRLAPGEARLLSDAEVRALQNAAGGGA